jgi:hypothetical protein
MTHRKPSGERCVDGSGCRLWGTHSGLTDVLTDIGAFISVGKSIVGRGAESGRLTGRWEVGGRALEGVPSGHKCT